VPVRVFFFVNGQVQLLESYGHFQFQSCHFFSKINFGFIINVSLLNLIFFSLYFSFQKSVADVANLKVLELCIQLRFTLEVFSGFRGDCYWETYCHQSADYQSWPQGDLNLAFYICVMFLLRLTSRLGDGFFLWHIG